MCLIPASAPTSTIPARAQVLRDATELLDTFMAVEADTNSPGGLAQAGFDMVAIRARAQELRTTMLAYCREAFTTYQPATTPAEALHAAALAHAYFVATYQTQERAVAIAWLRQTEAALPVLIGHQVSYPSRFTAGERTTGTVLETYDAGDIRVDTDGVIGLHECEWSPN